MRTPVAPTANRPPSPGNAAEISAHSDMATRAVTAFWAGVAFALKGRHASASTGAAACSIEVNEVMILSRLKFDARASAGEGDPTFADDEYARIFCRRVTIELYESAVSRCTPPAAGVAHERLNMSQICVASWTTASTVDETSILKR